MARHADHISMTPELFQLRATQYIDNPIDIEGIPSHHLIMSKAVEYNPKIRQPEYSMGELAKFIFGFSYRRMSAIMKSIEPSEMAKHPWAVPTHTANIRWTLEETERLVHILRDMKKISYDRMVIALHIICWTAKAHGLYV